MMQPTYIQSHQQLSYMGEYLGFQEGSDGELRLEAKEGFFCSEVFDSGTYQTTWDELHIQIENVSAAQLYVWVFDTFEKVSLLSSLSILDRYYAIAYEGISYQSKDVLLYDQKTKQGRYLVFAIHLTKLKKEPIMFTSFKLSFPARKFSEYLPNIYHDKIAIERYLSVFKDILVEMEQKIRHFENQLDVETCDEIYVKELLSWVSLDHYLNYTDLITARSLPRFFHDRKQYMFSRQFYQELWEHLFHNPAYIYQKEDELHILTPCTNTASACAMQHFCDQELPFHLTIKLQFIKQAYLDENAYCGYSSILQFPIENKLGKASFNQKETIML